MKHRSKRVLAVLCVLAILVSFPVCAFADDASTAAQKGQEAIKATGDQKYIQLPKERSYLDEFKTRYVDFSDVLIPKADGQVEPMYGPCAPVERKPNKTCVLAMPFAYTGTKVTVVAEEGKYSCIIYRSSDNKMRAGWIWNIYLGDEYIGKSLTIGKENSSTTGNIAEVPISWSKKGFLDSQQWYSVLKEPVDNCVGFTLEYQLIAENTKKWCTVLGPRNVYVNNGEKWIKVGSFEYPEFGTVQVRVNLEEPTDIVAIGTIAECSKPDLFRFRQFAMDYATIG